MIAKLRVFSGALTHCSAGDTFWPVQFGFLAKLPAAAGGSLELSAMPGEVRREAVGGPSCWVGARAVGRGGRPQPLASFSIRPVLFSVCFGNFSPLPPPFPPHSRHSVSIRSYGMLG